MHKATTLKHESHHWYDSLDEHFHSIQFWVGAIFALMFVGFLTLLYLVVLNDPHM